MNTDKWTGPRGWVFPDWERLAGEYEDCGASFPYAAVQTAVYGEVKTPGGSPSLICYYTAVDLTDIVLADVEMESMRGKVAVIHRTYPRGKLMRPKIPHVGDSPTRFFNFVVRRLFFALKPAYEVGWGEGRNPRRLREHIGRILAPLNLGVDLDPRARKPIHRAITNLKGSGT